MGFTEESKKRKSCKNTKRKTDAAQGSSSTRKQKALCKRNQVTGNEKRGDAIRAQLMNESGKGPASYTKCHTYIGTSDIAKEPLRMDSPEAEEAVRQFINLCNEASSKKIEDKVTSTFDHLNTPRKQVNPGFQCVKFYKGDTSLASDEYIPDDLYVNHTKRVFKGKATKLKNFFENDENYTALVADAGAGKTTAAKRFARLVLDKKIEQLKDIKLVHFVNLAELDCEEERNAFDLLFRPAHGLTEKMKTYGMQWVEDNSSEILLVLDGLDQTSWSLKDEVSTFPFDKPSHASKIIQNILKKHLLPDCKILLTSREHAIKNFLSNIRPQKIVALTGLSNEDRDFLIAELGGEEKGQRILEHLKLKLPYVLSLCATPIFNLFTVAILSKDLENAPSTMSEILIRVLVCFLNSNNRREKDIYWIFHKLKELAHHGTHQKRVLFRREEVTNLGLSVNQVNDLVSMTPFELPFELPNLVEGYYRLFFCHQSVQETLTALFICERPVSEFKQFVQDHLDDPHFRVVRKIIFGVILNPKINIPMNQEVIGAIPGKKEKIVILQDWLQNVLHHRNRNSRKHKSTQPWNIIKSRDLELYSILNECRAGASDVIKHHLHNVKITQRQLRADSLYVLCTVLAQCERLDKLELGEVIPCNADIHLLEKCILLAEQVKIEYMRLDEGMDLARFVQLFRNTLAGPGEMQGDDKVPGEVFEAEKKKSFEVSQVDLGSMNCEQDHHLFLTVASFFPVIGCINLSFGHVQLKVFQDSCEIQGESKLQCHMRNISLENMKNFLSSVISVKASFKGKTTGSGTDITATSKQQSSLEGKAVKAFRHGGNSGNSNDADEPGTSKWKFDIKLKNLLREPDLPQGTTMTEEVNTQAAPPIGAKLYMTETQPVQLMRNLTGPNIMDSNDREKSENTYLEMTDCNKTEKVIVVTGLTSQQNAGPTESEIQLKGFVYTSSFDNYVHVGFSDATLKNDLIQSLEGINADRRLELNSFAVQEDDEISVTINLHHDDELRQIISISPENGSKFSVNQDFLEGDRKFVNEFYLKSSDPVEEESVPLICTVKRNGVLVAQNGKRQFALEWQEDLQNLGESSVEPGTLEDMGEIMDTCRADMNEEPSAISCLCVSTTPVAARMHWDSVSLSKNLSAAPSSLHPAISAVVEQINNAVKTPRNDELDARLVDGSLAALQDFLKQIDHLSLQGDLTEPETMKVIVNITRHGRGEKFSLPSGLDITTAIQHDPKDQTTASMLQLNSWSIQDMDPAVFHQLGEIAVITGVKRLTLRQCNITKQKLLQLRDALTEYKGEMLELSLGKNENMEPAAFQHIGEIAVITRVRKLGLGSCKMNGAKLLSLKNALVGYNGKMGNLDVSFNEHIDYKLLGEIIRICRVNKLKLRCCKLKPDQVDDLSSSMGEMKQKVKVAYAEIDRLLGGTYTMEQLRQEVVAH